MEENKEITIEIPEAVVNFIQRLDVECQSYRTLLSYIIAHEDMDIPTDRFKEYEEKYLKTTYAFEIAKTEFENKFITIPLQLNSNYKWHLIYKDNIVQITKG